MTTRSAHLTIFEGPDGGGKSTLARVYAEQTGARYVHFGPLPHMRSGLARVYAEAMLPAVLGYQPVVFDRSWLSERPYAMAFRNGRDRLGPLSQRMLERLALRCGAVVVLCQPPLAVALDTYEQRKREEYLKTKAQLVEVYGHYDTLRSHLPIVRYNYREHLGEHFPSVVNGMDQLMRMCRSPLHPARHQTAGRLDAPVMLVGESFAQPRNHDLLYQWPFASFSSEGCSQWLTQQLDTARIGESQLLFVNADDIPHYEMLHFRGEIIALGSEAKEKVRYRLAMTKRDGVKSIHPCPHPAYWKRFHPHSPYPLIALLRRLLA